MTDMIKNGITLNIGGVPYALYNVYLYMNDNQQHSEFYITDAHTTFYGETDNTLGTFQQITNTMAGVYTAAGCDGDYVEFTGEISGSLTIIAETGVSGGDGGICGLQIVNAGSSASYANNFVGGGNAGLDVTGAATAQIGTLSIGTATLAVTGGSTGSNAAYTLTAGNVTVTGNPTFDVAKNGSGAGMLLLGSLAGDGTARTITIQDNGAVALTSAVTSLMDGSAVNVNSGALNLNAAGALGSLVNVTMSDSATVNLGTNQTVGRPQQQQRHSQCQRRR